MMAWEVAIILGRIKAHIGASDVAVTSDGYLLIKWHDAYQIMLGGATLGNLATAMGELAYHLNGGER